MMRADVRALFPERVAGADSLHLAAPLPLLEEEAAAIARAVDKRKREFAWGRSCAASALSQLGFGRVALAPLPDRTVPWPHGAVGSITHADGYVAAVATTTDVARGIGIDAEVKGRVHRALWKQIASEHEQAWFRAADTEAEALTRATLLFSAKEAFYKAQYCLSRAWVGFHDVALTVEGDRFEIVLVKGIASLAPRGARFEGRALIDAKHVVTALWIA